MNEFVFTVIRGWGRKQRRIYVKIVARTRGAAFRIVRQSAYLVGRARIADVREVTA